VRHACAPFLRDMLARHGVLRDDAVSHSFPADWSPLHEARLVRHAGEPTEKDLLLGDLRLSSNLAQLSRNPGRPALAGSEFRPKVCCFAQHEILDVARFFQVAAALWRAQAWTRDGRPRTRAVLLHQGRRQGNRAGAFERKWSDVPMRRRARAGRWRFPWTQGVAGRLRLRRRNPIRPRNPFLTT
jgi:hypothetical protein